ncbi:centrosomal protein of 112 kDa-like [Tachysurus ichikawai]
MSCLNIVVVDSTGCGGYSVSSHVWSHRLQQIFLSVKSNYYCNYAFLLEKEQGAFGIDDAVPLLSGCRGETVCFVSFGSAAPVVLSNSMITKDLCTHCKAAVSEEKEDHICHLREFQRQQVQQAESALESFKKQVELSSEKAYADMKQQMEKVEADLTRSKSLREKQTKEFGHQLEELQQKYEQQVSPGPE